MMSSLTVFSVEILFLFNAVKFHLETAYDKPNITPWSFYMTFWKLSSGLYKMTTGVSNHSLEHNYGSVLVVL